MTGRHPSRIAARAAALACLLTLVLGASPASAARDRQAPTKPTNLRVTTLSTHTITLAWDPSTDNSGTFSYRVWVSYGYTHTVPQTQTTHSLGVVPNNTYSFFVYAVDGSGNTSARSNTVSATVPSDTTAPTPPVLSVAGVNPTEVALQWTASTDDDAIIYYQVFVNGSPNVDTRSGRSAVVHGLTPQTTYEFTVKARDFYGQNVSAPSNVVTVTTAAVSATDTEPPSAPVCCGGGDVGSGGELHIFWGESFDNQTSQAGIRYEIYLNGVLDHVITGDDRTIFYTTQSGENTITIIAVDRAGNRSAPATITIVVQSV
jgi:hypothetical protein